MIAPAVAGCAYGASSADVADRQDQLCFLSEEECSRFAYSSLIFWCYCAEGECGLCILSKLFDGSGEASRGEGKLVAGGSSGETGGSGETGDRDTSTLLPLPLPFPLYACIDTRLSGTAMLGEAAA